MLLAFPLISPSCPFHDSSFFEDVLVMSPSMPFNSPFMSLSFSRYVRFNFRVCPFLSLPVISLHLPSCPLVFLSFVCLAVPPHSPCFHVFPLHVLFSSPSCPVQFPCFPFISPCMCLHFPLFPPLISLHFLAFSLCSPIFFREKMIFGRRRQNARTSKELAGDSSLGPLFCQEDCF